MTLTLFLDKIAVTMGCPARAVFSSVNDVCTLDVCSPGNDPVKKEADRAVKAMKEIRMLVRGKLKGI